MRADCPLPIYEPSGFLVATQRLYMSVCPSVGPLVRPLVGWLVGHAFVFRPTRSDECRVYGPFTCYIVGVVCGV